MDHSVFAEALSSVSQGVLIAGQDRRLLYANPAFCVITGYQPADFIGQGCKFLQGPDSDPAVIAQIGRALDHAESFNGEILNYKKTGEAFWNELSITPVGKAGAGPAYFIGITRDITLRKASESGISKLERHYQFLFDHVQAGIVLHGTDTSVLYANATASRMLGVDHQQIRGAVHSDERWDFVHQDGTTMAHEAYPVNRAIMSGRVIKNLVVGVNRGGGNGIVWLLCNAYPVHDDLDGQDKVVVSFTDITELKQAEWALQKSEERLRLMLRGANDAAWDFDLLTNEAYFSPRWWEMIGFEPGEVSGGPELLRQMTHPEDREGADKVFDLAIQGTTESYEVEFRLRHKAGHYVPILSRGFVLRDAYGRAVRVSGTNLDLTERKQAEEKINHLAFYDVLTGLPNRRLFLDLLRRAVSLNIQSGNQGALMLINVDNFKVLNDTRGQHVGDQLLQEIAGTLVARAARIEQVARLGGDEFALLIENQGAGRDGITAAMRREVERVRTILNVYYRLGSLDYRCSVSVGVAMFGDGGAGVDETFKQAHLALHKAKASGAGAISFFDHSMQVAIEAQHELEIDLRTALEGDQLALYIQRQVDMSGVTIGGEALLRWHHPERGMVMPGVFVPVAESTGLILELGAWVLRAACRQLAIWAAIPEMAGLSISVNVSVRQFTEGDFVEHVLRELEQSGAPATLLKLEITESVLAQNIADIVMKMERLRLRGVRFSLDDFGTGYSSLSYLQRLPLDEIKIDRAFVANVLDNQRDAAIARIIISLAENLGLTVLAEGVETEGQQQFLADHGCTQFQGYLFGRPETLEAFEGGLISAS